MSALRVLAASCLLATLVAVAPSAQAGRTPAVHAAAPSYVTLPTRFEPNVGQADGSTRFVARTRDGAVALGDGDLMLRSRGGATVRITPVGGAAGVRSVGLDPLPGETAYLRGGDPSRWRAHVPGYARVRSEGVFPGVDLVTYGANGHLEYDVVVAPGADARCVRFRVEGADRVELDAAGDLRIVAGSETIRHRAPVAFQPAPDGRRPVAARFVVEGNEVAFAIGAVDPTLPLVLDPEVAFATYLGGTDFDDGADIAVGPDGSVYVVGSTTSADFPTASALQPELADAFGSDVFVAKLAPDGASLVYATYLGGTDFESADAVAVDDLGAVYVGGVTASPDFPLLSALQPTLRGPADAFVAKLAPDGQSLVYATFLGGSGDEQTSDLHVRADHAVVVAGRTTSADFPTAGAVASSFGGGGADGFVAVLAAGGTSLVQSVYVGGDGNEQVDSVALGADGTLYATGVTDATDLPACEASESRAFAARLTPAALSFAAFGCDGTPITSSVAATEPLGATAGGSFELRALAAAGGAGALDIRAISLGADLGFLRDTVYGGSGQEYPDAVAVGANGSLYVAGDTDSTDLPTVEPTQAGPGGDLDAFVAVFAPGSGALQFATYLGGADVEFPTGIATDADGNLYVTGLTFSTDFPTTSGAVQPGLGGGSDAFVVKITAPRPPGPDFTLSGRPSAATVKPGQKVTLTIDINRSGGFTGGVTVTPSDTKPLKLKVTPGSATTTGSSITLTVKAKKKAAPGAYPIVFTGRDASGRTRVATFTLTVM
jgi:hypothetical protein